MSEIGYLVEDRVAIISLEAPDRGNAFNPTMRRELNEAFERYRGDDDAWVAVICAEGPDFCNGSEASAVLSHEEQRDRARYWAGGRLDTIKPTIAAVQGACRGEGLALALGCDLRLASEPVAFQAGLDSLGSGPNVEAVWLVNLVGLSVALDLLWTRRTVDAVQAARLGLINRLVSADNTPAEAQAGESLAEGRLAVRPLGQSMVTPDGSARSGGDSAGPGVAPICAGYPVVPKRDRLPFHRRTIPLRADTGSWPQPVRQRRPDRGHPRVCGEPPAGHGTTGKSAG